MRRLAYAGEAREAPTSRLWRAGTPRARGLHIVVLDRYAAGWIGEGFAFGTSTRHTTSCRGGYAGGWSATVSVAAFQTAASVDRQHSCRRSGRCPHRLPLRHNALGLDQASHSPGLDSWG